MRCGGGKKGVELKGKIRGKKRNGRPSVIEKKRRRRGERRRRAGRGGEKGRGGERGFFRRGKGAVPRGGRRYRAGLGKVQKGGNQKRISWQDRRSGKRNLFLGGDHRPSARRNEEDVSAWKQIRGKNRKKSGLLPVFSQGGGPPPGTDSRPEPRQESLLFLQERGGWRRGGERRS